MYNNNYRDWRQKGILGASIKSRKKTFMPPTITTGIGDKKGF